MGGGNPPTWFSRGGAIVRATEDGRGMLCTKDISAAGARVDVERHLAIKSCKEVDGDLVLQPATMSEPTAKAILKSGEAERMLPPLRRVQRFPYLRADGTGWQVEANGYNRDTGIYVIGHHSPQAMPLEEAVAAILELLSEFQFATPADQSRAIASILTPALQASSTIRGSVPVTIVEADQSQAGKGLFVQTSCALYDEEAHWIAKRSGGVGSLDESLATSFLRGGAFVVFDNIRGSLKSEYLEAALTANSAFPVRVPHKGEILVDVSQSTIWVTSNGFVSTVDLANRASFVRIRKRTGHVYRPLPQIIKEHLDFYQGCILTVVRSYLEANCPRTNEGRHSFHPWAQSLDWIVQHYFGQPPLLNGHQDAQNSVSSPHFAFLRALAHAVVQEGRQGETLRASDLADICVNRDVQIVEGRDNCSLESGVGARTIGQKLRPLFRDEETVAVDGYQVSRQTSQACSSIGNRYRDLSYRFTESEDAAASTNRHDHQT